MKIEQALPLLMDTWAIVQYWMNVFQSFSEADLRVQFGAEPSTKALIDRPNDIALPLVIDAMIDVINYTARDLASGRELAQVLASSSWRIVYDPLAHQYVSQQPEPSGLTVSLLQALNRGQITTIYQFWLALAEASPADLSAEGF